ncbi:MAG: FeoB-associated Cys-rich membrane protein [Angelakisella sp.]|jgi:hypothetical protein|nr:FeoB-associated Cys-rich membrane protein [Angelakisella sp.]
MTVADVIVIVLIGAGAVLAVRSARRDSKKGGCAGCSGCGGGVCPREQAGEEEQQP